jgi:hypothetical protein
MPKRTSRPKRPADINQLAYQLVKESTEEPREQIQPLPKPTRSEISRIMAEMGRRGGKIGGKRRLKTMTAKDRKMVAVKAAEARWKKKKRK